MTDGMPPDPDDRSSDGFGVWLDALADAADEDSVFDVLAGKRPPSSRLARQQLRGRLVKVLGQKFSQLESGASAAKTADAWLYERGVDGDLLQGKAFVAEETEPWGTFVAGADVLDETVDVLGWYVYAPAPVLDAIALWAAYTHVFDCFGVSPILGLSSPTKRCGKSSVVVVLRQLCRSALLSGNITPAALFRSIAAWKPTLLIDEADTFAAMHDELRGILNAGHTRDTAYVIRAEGDANEPRMFSTWAPKVVAAIGHLPDTIEDRSIRCVMARKPTREIKRDAFDSPAVQAACAPVRRRLARFVLDNLDAIAAADVQRPAGLHDRAWNNWRPLFAVASAAGPEWLARAAAAAKALSDGDTAEEDITTLTLQLVWDLLAKVEQAPTRDVLDHLVGQDEGPYSQWWEKDLADDRVKGPSAKLAKLLKPFGIKPKQLWIGERNVRGYEVDDFRAPAVTPYLEKDASADRDARPVTQSHGGF
jgi:hypothetical protein